MSKTFKVRRKYHCLFEKDNELIYVKYEDLQGYIHFEYSDDPTQQDYTMTPVELSEFERVYT